MVKHFILKLPLVGIIIMILLLATNCGDQQRSADVIKKSAYSFMEEEKFDSALIEAQRSRELDSISGNQMGQAESLYILSRASAMSGNFEAAMEYAKKGAKLSRTMGNDSLEYRLNNMISWSFFELGADIYKILEHEERQLQLVDQLDDENAKANTYNNYGYDATVAGTIELDKAIEYAQFANDYYARTEAHQGRWYTLMNLTWQYRLKNDLDISEEYGRLSAKQALADEDRHAIVEANTQLAETYLAKGELGKAVPYYQDGLKWRGDINDRDGYVFDVYYARYLWETGKRSEAIEMLLQAVEYLEQSEVFYEMHGRAMLAVYCEQQGNLDMARVQINIIENPRNNFISFETRCLAALVKQKIANDDEKETAEANIQDHLKQARQIGAIYLVALLESL